jgi:hypothetical protein
MQIIERVDEDTYIAYEVPPAPEGTLIWQLFYPAWWIGKAMLFTIVALIAVPVILIGLIRAIIEELTGSSSSGPPGVDR